MRTAPDKILFGTFDCLPAATGRAARSLQFLEALSGDFECHCVCLQDEGQPLVEDLGGVHFRRVLTEGLALSECIEVYAQTVCSELDRISPRIVLVADPFSARVLCALRGRLNFRIIYEAAGLPSFEFEALEPACSGALDAGAEASLRQALRRQERFCLQNVDAVLVGSATTAALLRSWGVDQSLISILPTSADLSLPAPARAQAPGRPLELFFEGTFSPWQGLPTLLEGLAKVRAQMPMHLTMMGAPRPRWFMESLRQRIEALALGPAVTLVEPLSRDALEARLQEVDVGVVPLDACPRNVEQGAPLAKVARYLASGLPVIASDLPMARELLDDRCALFFEPGNADALADRLVALASDPAQRASLGTAARRQAESSLSSLRTRSVLKMLCEALLESLPEPGGALQVRAVDVGPASDWLMEASAQAVEQGSAERELDPEDLELDAGEADIEEIEAEEIDEIGDHLSCPAPDAEAREVAPEELEDADDLLEEAVEAAAGQPAPGEIDAAAGGVRPAEIDDLIEQAIEAQIETVQPACGDMPLNVAAPSSELAREISACLSGAQSTAPGSGVSAAEEWLGHALFGYAPFGIPLGDRAQAATVEFSPVPRGQGGEPCRRAREDGAG